MACLIPTKLYFPVPPRQWSRVQGPCSLIIDDNKSGLVKLPYTGKIISASKLGEELQMLEKGNVLQYKKNSGNLTQKQKYSLIAQGKWVNRNTTWATQSTRGYTNPNNLKYQRVGSINITLNGTPTDLPLTCPQPIKIINSALPLVYPSPGNPVVPPEPEIPPEPEVDIPPVVEEPPGVDAGTELPIVPVATPSQPVVIQDGGNLVCRTYEDPCTGIIVEQYANLSQFNDCQPSTASDVPGPLTALCWNDGLPTWYPRQRYVMTNSGNKWPDNAPLFSAILPLSPILYATDNNNCSITLYWQDPNKNFVSSSPISGYNIYVNNNLHTTLPMNINSYIFTGNNGDYSFFITAVRELSESLPSNIINETISFSPPTILSIINNTPSTATITWNNNLSSVSSYNIYRSTSPGGGYSMIVNVPLSSYPMSYVDTGLTPNITYYYYITSVYSSCESEKTPTVSITTDPLYVVTGNPTITQSGGYYYFTFNGNGTFLVNYAVTNFNVIAVGGGGGAGGGARTDDFQPGINGGGGGGGGGIGLLSSYIPTTSIAYNIVVGSGGSGGSGNNQGLNGNDSSFKNGITNYLTAIGGKFGGSYYIGSALGGLGGTASSDITITSYNGGNGGDGYRQVPGPIQTPTNGSNTTAPIPITLPNSTNYYFSGGGGGGIYDGSLLGLGGAAGNNGIGGNAGGNISIYGLGQSATTYGSGGGGGGCPNSVSGSTLGGSGAKGVVIIYFSYP
jgi:hypothetical protein